MKKLFPLFLLLSSGHVLADEADTLLTDALEGSHKELAEEAPMLKDKKETPKQEKKKDKKEDLFKIFDESFEESFVDMLSHMDKMWRSVHQEMATISKRIDTTFKTKEHKRNKKLSLDDQDRDLIISFAVPKGIAVEDAMLDVIDNKQFKIKLEGEVESVNFVGVVSRNMLHAKISYQEKITKDGNTRSSLSESSLSQPFVGNIKDLESNVMAQFDEEKGEMILTLHKETKTKSSIKVMKK